MKANTIASITLVLAAICAATFAPGSPTPASAPSATPPPPACVAPEFRQFDFWVGRWKVTNPQGVQVGASEVARVSEGCALREQWNSARGGSGTSLNYYDAGNRQWHQDWVGGDGTILHLHGGVKEGAMILTGESNGRQGPVVNRITWTPLPDGKVKQEWVVSRDQGKTWQNSFVGIYEKEP